MYRYLAIFYYLYRKSTNHPLFDRALVEFNDGKGHKFVLSLDRAESVFWNIEGPDIYCSEQIHNIFFNFIRNV